MSTYNVRFDAGLSEQVLQEFNGWVDQRVTKQMAYAQHVTLRRVAFMARDAVIDEMARRFDAPTPYVLRRSVFVEAATKGYEVPRSRIFISDGSNGGAVPPEDVLEPEYEGGARKPKRYERILSKLPGAGGNMFWGPGGNIRLNRHGNIAPSTLGKILRNIRADYALRKYGTSRTKYDTIGGIFIGRINGRLGAWKRVSKGHLAAMLIGYERPPVYAPRVHFSGTVERTVAGRLGPTFREVFAKAMATAR